MSRFPAALILHLGEPPKKGTVHAERFQARGVRFSLTPITCDGCQQ